MFLGVDGKIQVLPPSKFEDGSGQSLLLESEASFVQLVSPDSSFLTEVGSSHARDHRAAESLPSKPRKGQASIISPRNKNNATSSDRGEISKQLLRTASSVRKIPHQPCNAAWVVIRRPQKLMPGACFELPNRVSHLKRRSEPLGPSTL
ncbi:hypothetical protein GX48_05243 [Paracoccidioides brasiliensis]|nr:hypothetical protein GX48_05243 [Paracoccidioides brasiliensis]